MASKIGLVVILAMITMTKALTKDCTKSEILGTFFNGTGRTTEFVQENGNLLIKEFTGGVLQYTSQMENCGVTQKDDKDGEIVMAFKVIAPHARYCIKLFYNNYIVFYTRNIWKASDSGLTVDECINILKHSTAYTILVKNVPPITTPRESPPVTFPGVDYSSVVKPGIYQLDVRQGNPFTTGNYNFECDDNALSTVEITNVAWTFIPCTQGTTSHSRPFRKPLPILGYVSDEMLDTVANALREQQGFVALAYPDGSNSFKYLVLRVAVKALINPTDETYLQVTTVIPNVNELPTGFVDLIYVPSSGNQPTSNIAGVPRTNAFDVFSFQIHSSECQSQPCLNSGTCIQHWQNYTCICPDGYGGDRCEIMDNECANQDANICNNGMCEDTPYGYICTCEDGYDGFYCDETTVCVIGTCLNGGVCYDPDENDYEHYCHCPYGYSGDRCQHISSCNSQPCKNSAMCYELLTNDEYFCLCMDGWTGYNCDQPIGVTTDTPPVTRICVPDSAVEICQNGGTCIDGKCECEGFYIGKFCERINPWFVGSIVLIALLILLMIITLIVCCFCCWGGRTASGGDSEKKPYNPFKMTVPDYAPSTQGYGPTGFTVTQSQQSEPSMIFTNF